jgi:hypothetical protein
MTRVPLRIATSDPLVSIEMAEAIEARMRECIAACPTAVLIAWEIPGKTDTEVVCLTIPNSLVLRRGMIDLLFDQQHPEPAVE